MTRWEPNPRGRLEQAAMELYQERGFDHTTAAQIAERAGLTERTFFRHFADKREILFGGGDTLEELVVAAVTAAPESATPLEAALAGIKAAGEMLERARGRAFARERQKVIAASPDLRERELCKLAALARAVSMALRARDGSGSGADIAGEVAVAIFRIAFERWVSETDGHSMDYWISESLAILRTIAAPDRLASSRACPE